MKGGLAALIRAARHWQPTSLPQTGWRIGAVGQPSRCFRAPLSTSACWRAEGRELKTPSQHDQSQRENGSAAAEQAKDKQRRTPWHREGADVPPVERSRSADATTKGKLLTTPSKLLKLIIPLNVAGKEGDQGSVEPLALVVHPQQPLSYLERLIQSELPTITNEKGDERIPAIFFKAERSQGDDGTDDAGPRSSTKAEADDGLEQTNIDGKIEKTGVINPRKKRQSLHESADASSPKPAGTAAPASSGDGSAGRFVRWSSSTEIGDFIRDANRGMEFVVEIEGLASEIHISVPSFRDRTHYLRARLRRIAHRIADMVAVKEECDRDAHRAAQHVAIVGFALLVVWWIGVYYLTFKTNLGWDTMEPITYLVGLSGLMCGYLWFLYHNREVSYRAAMNLTISRRQSQLYAARGFHLDRWEELVREGNALRQEIKAIASEYDVEWNEAADEHDETVMKALKKERDKKRKRQEDEQEQEEVEIDTEEAAEKDQKDQKDQDKKGE